MPILLILYINSHPRIRIFHGRKSIVKYTCVNLRKSHRIWKSRLNFVWKCLDKGLTEIPYLLLLVDWQFWLFHVRILNAFKYIIFSNPFKCIPNHFRQEFNSNLPPREPLQFGTALRATVLDIDKTSYSLSSDFTIKWNHASDSCLRKAENLYFL